MTAISNVFLILYLLKGIKVNIFDRIFGLMFVVSELDLVFFVFNKNLSKIFYCLIRHK